MADMEKDLAAAQAVKEATKALNDAIIRATRRGIRVKVSHGEQAGTSGRFPYIYISVLKELL